MNGILGMAELLYQTGLTDTQTEMIKTIRDSGDALLTIINDILDLARIEAGKISFSPRPFVPSDLIRHADALHGASARLKGLDLSVVIGPGLDKPRIGDSDRLGQVLGNLIGNAIKFTETGTVRVNASAPTPETLQFSITDTGVGMTDEQVRRVFGEFEQADNSISRRFGGSGLGLAISLRLIELMQGRIKISSKLGVGTTVDVEVRLPLADEIAGPALQAPVVESIPPGLHVLVAEDNKTNTAILAAMLRTLGATAEFAVNGEEAVAAWRPGAFDLLLIDVSMPVMDGMEALRQIVIRAAEAGVSAPPAIAVTANVMPSQISEYLEKGFAGVLGKPYRRSELVSKVNDVLGNRA
jgi:CheY-like chemotaxis protein